MSDQRRNIGPAKATWSIVASIVAHVGVLTGIGYLAYQSLHAREKRDAELAAKAPPQQVIAIELPSMAEGTLTADRDEVVEGAPPDNAEPVVSSKNTGCRTSSIKAFHAMVTNWRIKKFDEPQSLRTAAIKATA